MIRSVLMTSIVLLMAGCAATAPDPRPAQSQCARTVVPANERIAVWSVDKFAGRYARGADTIIIWRDDHRLFIGGWTLGTRQLTSDTVESWTWRDGCGVRYEFTLPPDGPGGRLAENRDAEWHGKRLAPLRMDPIGRARRYSGRTKYPNWAPLTGGGRLFTGPRPMPGAAPNES